MAREMKDSGIEWIGAIPNNWNCIDCKYIFKNEKKIVGPRENEYERLALTLNGVVKRSKDDSTGLQTERFDSYQILLPSELVFKMLDLKNISTSRVGFSPYKGIVSPAYIILKTEKNNVSKFFYYYFYNMWQRTIFNQMGNSGVRSSLTASDMLNLPVIVPDIHEQKNIANYLDKQCSEIDLLTADIEKQISVLEDYKKSVITEAVTKGLDPNVEMKDSGVEWIGDIPKHWIISKIKHIAKINPKCDIRKLNLYSVVTYSPMECIRNNTFENRPINYEELPPSLTRFQEGDLVMAKVSPCFENGNISIMKDLYSGVGFGSSELFVFRANPITTRYLCYFLQNTNCKNYEILSFSGIAGLQRINSDHLRNTNITIPNINEQKQIADYLDKKCSEIDSLISEKKEQLEKLASYKQSMIYAYVTGKKEVPSKENA